MISIDNRRKIFIRHLINFETIRGISKELDISRSTISKIIISFRLRITELNLLDEPDLKPFIDSIVIEPKRKLRIVPRYKVTAEHDVIIEKLIKINDEKRTRYGKTNTKNIQDLYADFLNEISEPIEDAISLNTFYNLVRKLKKIKWLLFFTIGLHIFESFLSALQKYKHPFCYNDGSADIVGIL